jgi:hypothetical protein
MLLQADVGVTPMVLQDTMASMLEHARAWPTEYDDVPFLQVRMTATSFTKNQLQTFIMLSWVWEDVDDVLNPLCVA